MLFFEYTNKIKYQSELENIFVLIESKLPKIAVKIFVECFQKQVSMFLLCRSAPLLKVVKANINYNASTSVTWIYLKNYKIKRYNVIFYVIPLPLCNKRKKLASKKISNLHFLFAPFVRLFKWFSTVPCT